MKLAVQRRHFLVGNGHALFVGRVNQSGLNGQTSRGGGATNSTQNAVKRG